MGIIERILCKLFPYTDIMRDDTNDIYLRRWFIYPRHKEFKKLEPRIYLHKFYRGDEDPHLHDHPWPFTSLILTQGYWEETFDEDGEKGTGEFPCYVTGPDGSHRMQQFYKRFSILRRPATWKHRVILDNNKPVWTIVRTGVKERSWGFWVNNALCPWRNYSKGVCWCENEGKSNPDVEE